MEQYIKIKTEQWTIFTKYSSSKNIGIAMISKIFEEVSSVSAYKYIESSINKNKIFLVFSF